MATEIQVVENIILQVKQLSPESRLRLIQRIIETLKPPFTHQSKLLQFGKYKSDKMSTLEDFSIAEWHSTDKDLNGE
jgi:hypothetical protein